MYRYRFLKPLFKSRNRSNISAKLNVIPKLFEKIITEILNHQVDSYLSPYQNNFYYFPIPLLESENNRNHMKVDCILSIFPLSNVEENIYPSFRVFAFKTPINSSIRPGRYYIPLKIQYFHAYYANADCMEEVSDQFKRMYSLIKVTSNPDSIKRIIFNFLKN